MAGRGTLRATRSTVALTRRHLKAANDPMTHGFPLDCKALKTRSKILDRARRGETEAQKELWERYHTRLIPTSPS